MATEFVPGVSLGAGARAAVGLLPIEWSSTSGGRSRGPGHAHRERRAPPRPQARRRAASRRRARSRSSTSARAHLKALERVGPRPTAGLHYRAPEQVDRAQARSPRRHLLGRRHRLRARRLPEGLSRATPARLVLRHHALRARPRAPAPQRLLAGLRARAGRKAWPACPTRRMPRSRRCMPTWCSSVRETAPRLPREGAPKSGRDGSAGARGAARGRDARPRRGPAGGALDGVRQLLHRDSEDEAARRSMTEIESVLVDREVDALVGMALAYAADGQMKLATEIAEKVERLAPWSPRYLQLQVYLDEERRAQARRRPRRARARLRRRGPHRRGAGGGARGAPVPARARARGAACAGAGRGGCAARGAGVRRRPAEAPSARALDPAAALGGPRRPPGAARRVTAARAAQPASAEAGRAAAPSTSRLPSPRRLPTRGAPRPSPSAPPRSDTSCRTSTSRRASWSSAPWLSTPRTAKPWSWRRFFVFWAEVGPII